MPDARDPSEVELLKTDAPAAALGGAPRSPLPWILGAVVLVGAAVAAYVLFGRGPAPEPPAVVADAPPLEPATGDSPALAPAVEPLDLPPLAETDPIVRDLVRGLSAHPQVAAWLATDHLVRGFTAAVASIGRGQAPVSQLAVLRPKEPFRVSEGEDLVVDPRSYERYAPVAAAVESVDPLEAARLYAMLKPRIEDAYRELGETEPFDAALERALVMLLRTPVPREPVRLAPSGAVYAYADPALEALTPAQKQFARMGPRNMRIVQGRLREIALALGIPSGRLPD